MKKFNFYSLENEFNQKNEEEKVFEVKRDAYQLLIKYASLKIDFNELLEGIKILSTLDICTEKELRKFIKDRVGYETLEYSHGKSNETRDLLRERVFFAQKKL
ncbi:hypothetical protein [Aureispira sp. CCB-E]|uniref:hypothetical protein n=1 Tax=Aureispira sp. CCB-E TaxID=3051121 RepID=UPI0028686663|nr:hypothetical protein [Aureispira sp. CCB-E]WMX13139.1 hypothetical protein QP953_20055 [Aureispira sp. CCB-E]